MAAKKKITTTEEIIEDPPKEYSDIHNKTIREVVEDATTEPAEEKPPVVVKEAKPPEPEEETIEFDPEDFKKKTIAEAADTIIARISGTKDNPNEKDKELLSPWQKEKRNPRDYDEIAEWAVQKAQIMADKRAKEAQDSSEKQKQAYAQSQKENADRINSFIDKELGELYEEGKLPKVKNKDDARDPGIMARQALFKTMLDVNQKLTSEGKPAEYSIYKIFTKYYKSPTRQPAGADAPISIGRSGQNDTDSDQQINYLKDIHKKSFYELLRGR